MRTARFVASIAVSTAAALRWSSRTGIDTTIITTLTPVIMEYATVIRALPFVMRGRIAAITITAACAIMIITGERQAPWPEVRHSIADRLRGWFVMKTSEAFELEKVPLGGHFSHRAIAFDGGAGA